MDNTTAHLADFLATFTRDADGTRMISGEHFFDISPAFRDFNREIVKPSTPDGTQDYQLIDGGIGIRGDWDFWLLAFLPFRFSSLDCEQIVRTIWPDVTKAVFLPDTGDYWWEAQSDESLEVPGEPHEVWVHYDYDDRPSESQRYATFKNLTDALDRAGRITASPPIRWDIRTWVKGTRSEVSSGIGRIYET